MTAEVIRAARIRLRYDAGLTMRQLVRRPGAVVAGPTAVDVLLPAHPHDAAVRAAGLEADAVATAWAGPAVHFHHVDGIDVQA